ncbi:MAG: hypothetical protein ABF247_08995 [Nonlabens sp.]|uniref:hypothetical protein n=1 Tax=Nonlabens sp. TaxID=1888209 RepID=UPI00321B5CCA
MPQIKKLVLSLVAIMAVSFAYAQDLPTNTELGKCYVRCTTPDVYENETVIFVLTSVYKNLEVVPATYETVKERVMIKQASEK